MFTNDARLRTATATAAPFKKLRPVIPASCRTSATIVSSTWPRITFRSPKFEVDARNQFFPDLINLKRVTRSVSRNSPFERLKNIFFLLVFIICHLHYTFLRDKSKEFDLKPLKYYKKKKINENICNFTCLKLLKSI